jgi:hypothetical protein
MLSRDTFPNVLRVIHPTGGTTKPVAFFELYADEGGHSADKPFVVMAGYVAPADNWIGFRDEWNAALLGSGLKNKNGDGVGVFHMTDFESGHESFKGWTQERREKLLAKLFKIIKRRKLHAVGQVVGVDWFNANLLNLSDENHLPPEDPYHLACQCLLRFVLPDLKTRPSLQEAERLAVIIAEQREFGAAANRYMQATARALSDDKRVVTVTFGKMEDFPQLQAADIVAFELRWRFERPDVDRWPMRQMIEHHSFAGSAIPIDLAGISTFGEVDTDTFSDLILTDKRLARRFGISTSRKKRK